MKIEYQGRWLRLRIELFPKREGLGPIRYEPPRKAPIMRRRLMRQIQAQLAPPLTST